MSVPVVITFFAILLILASAVVFLLLYRRASAKRGTYAESEVWVVACAEKRMNALVDIGGVDTRLRVIDCSCWTGNGSCSRSCVAQIQAGKRGRILAQT